LHSFPLSLSPSIILGPAGNFQSFNYNSAAGQFLKNQNYVVCFRQEEGDKFFLQITSYKTFKVIKHFKLQNILSYKTF